ncbi:MAG: YjbQ family protein [Deltaproteobacteria bacterium]|nr:YjbQ family protein [Deltaproteobacteria bacterium]
MNVFSDTIRITTTLKTEDINITDMVESVIFESNIKEGSATVFTGHTTAGIHLNNNDPDLAEDLHGLLNELVSNKKKGFKHNKGDYGRNADAHIKSVLVGNGVTIPVMNNKLALGQWQGIYLSEFDGPRNRVIVVRVIGK